MLVQKNRANYIFDDETWQEMKNDEELQKCITYIFEYKNKEGVSPKPFVVSKYLKKKEPSSKYFKEYENLLYFLGCETAPKRCLYDTETRKIIDEDNCLNLYNKYFQDYLYHTIKFNFTNEGTLSHYCFVKVENKERFLINQETIRQLDTDTPENIIKRLEKQDKIHRELAQKYKSLWFYCNKENEQLRKDNEKLVELDVAWEELEKEREKIEKRKALLEQEKPRGIKGVLDKLEKEQKRNERLQKKVDKLQKRVENLTKRLEKHDKRLSKGKEERYVKQH